MQTPGPGCRGLLPLFLFGLLLLFPAGCSSDPFLHKKGRNCLKLEPGRREGRINGTLVYLTTPAGARRRSDRDRSENRHRTAAFHDAPPQTSAPHHRHRPRSRRPGDRRAGNAAPGEGAESRPRPEAPRRTGEARLPGHHDPRRRPGSCRSTRAATCRVNAMRTCSCRSTTTPRATKRSPAPRFTC